MSPLPSKYFISREISTTGHGHGHPGRPIQALMASAPCFVHSENFPCGDKTLLLARDIWELSERVVVKVRNSWRNLINRAIQTFDQQRNLIIWSSEKFEHQDKLSTSLSISRICQKWQWCTGSQLRYLGLSRYRGLSDWKKSSLVTLTWLNVGVGNTLNLVWIDVDCFDLCLGALFYFALIFSNKKKSPAAWHRVAEGPSKIAILHSYCLNKSLPSKMTLISVDVCTSFDCDVTAV